MGKVIDLESIKSNSRRATKEELKILFGDNPIYEQALGEGGYVEYDKKLKEYWVVAMEDGEPVEMIVGLFIAIVNANNK